MRKAGMFLAAVVVVGAGALILLQPDGQREAVAAEATIVLSSMICETCESVVEDAIHALPGIQSVAIDMGAKTATVKYAPDQLAVPQIEEAIANVGYSANDQSADPAAYAALPVCCKLE